MEKKRPQLESRKPQMQNLTGKRDFPKHRISSIYKYDIKTSNFEKRGIQMQDTGDEECRKYNVSYEGQVGSKLA